MRVIAGTARGRTLNAPMGMGTRPMMDVVKGSLFNMLNSLDAIGGRCLDLFAGSGSLGIEALSRGAEFVDFVEQTRAACDVIQENLERLHFSRQAFVHTKPVGAYLAHARTHGPAYDLIFIDAPYKDNVSLDVLAKIGAGDWLDAEGYVCIGHNVHEELPDTFGAFTEIKYRKFGASCISIFAPTPTAAPAPVVDSASGTPPVETDS